MPFVKNACRKGNILELRGKSVAIDVSCLLHRGLTGCMDKIHMGEETQSYVNYVNKYVKELLGMGCHVVMVFDGRPLPAKKGTNEERRELREKRKEHAEMLLAKGLEREARDTYRLATSISADIVENTIQYFRSMTNVDIVVAPYEADAQLAYLVQEKLVDAVITEDSDLIVFGCEMIYFKWQSATGECSVYEKCNLKNCFTGELGGDKFDFVKFRRICILSGCDYLQAGLPGVGLSTAAKFFSMTSIKDLRTLLRKVPSYLKNPKLKEHVNDEFIRNFEKAENTFKHQIVFDPRERCQKPLTPYPKEVLMTGVDDLEEVIDLDSPKKTAPSSKSFAYAGTASTQRIAIRLALGNPENKSSIDDQFLLVQPTPEWSVWGLRYESKGSTLDKISKQKELEATQCGGAFKLDSPSVKRVKVASKTTPNDDEDDIVKQFMADIEKEKKAIKKRKNAPQVDYNADVLLKKYAEPPPEKRQKILEVIDDDFSEFFQEKVKENTKESVAEEKVENSNEELKPPPILRKAVSTPDSARKTHKFQSPLLNHQNSAPPSLPDRKPAQTSKYFSKPTSENGVPKTKNPFRCPAFVKPTQKVEEKIEKTTILAALEENSVPMPSSNTTYRFVGFKSAGLRRKSKQ